LRAFTSVGRRSLDQTAVAHVILLCRAAKRRATRPAQHLARAQTPVKRAWERGKATTKCIHAYNALEAACAYGIAKPRAVREHGMKRCTKELGASSELKRMHMETAFSAPDLVISGGELGEGASELENSRKRNHTSHKITREKNDKLN